MCTLIAIHRGVPGRPLVVAANRDEYLDRPAEGLAVRETRVGRVMAPLDVRAGGTWLGLNEHGVFAALTNLRTDSPDPSRRSRGEIVLDALAAGSAGDAVDLLLAQLGEGNASETAPESGVAERIGGDSARYNPFNLFVADEAAAWVVVYRYGARAQQLEAGVHVIGNVDAMGPPNAKVERIRFETEAALRHGPSPGRARQSESEGTGSRHPANEPSGESGSEESGEGLLERLAALCRHHEDAGDPLGDTCVHVRGTHEGTIYGTRSSMLLELGKNLHTGRLLQADGPPCETQYSDQSFLLHDLGRRLDATGAEAQVRTAS